MRYLTTANFLRIHRRVIEEFGGSIPLREQFAGLVRRRQELLGQQKELTASRTLRRSEAGQWISIFQSDCLPAKRAEVSVERKPNRC